METNLLSVLEHGAEAVESRRNALAFVGKLSAGALFSMLPFGLADEAQAQSAGNDVDILNYALTLEYLESSFYNQFVPGTMPVPTPGPYTPATIPADVLPLFTKIRADEAKHVTFLAGQLGSNAIAPLPNTAFDFTAGGMFTPTDYDTFLILSQGFEDTGVRAYKGQAGSITNKDYLTAALNIHSVEARHAAAVRKVRGLRGWIEGDGTDLAAGAAQSIRASYQGGQTRTFNGATATDPSLPESNMTQVIPISPVAGRYDARQIQESFDEPLGTATVKNIVDPFVIPELGL